MGTRSGTRLFKLFEIELVHATTDSAYSLCGAVDITRVYHQLEWVERDSIEPSCICTHCRMHISNLIYEVEALVAGIDDVHPDDIAMVIVGLPTKIQYRRIELVLEQLGWIRYRKDGWWRYRRSNAKPTYSKLAQEISRVIGNCSEIGMADILGKNYTKPEAIKVGHAMRELGFERRKKRIKNKLYWKYVKI